MQSVWSLSSGLRIFSASAVQSGSIWPGYRLLNIRVDISFINRSKVPIHSGCGSGTLSCWQCRFIPKAPGFAISKTVVSPKTSRALPGNLSVALKLFSGCQSSTLLTASTQPCMTPLHSNFSRHSTVLSQRRPESPVLHGMIQRHSNPSRHLGVLCLCSGIEVYRRYKIVWRPSPSRRHHYLYLYSQMKEVLCRQDRGGRNHDTIGTDDGPIRIVGSHFI